MPFAYYGSKHGLAGKYPPPVTNVIIEPFAGAAGYSCYWALRRPNLEVVLTDCNPHVVELWRRLQSMTEDQVVTAFMTALEGDRTTEPLLGWIAGGSTIEAMMKGKDRQITPRMRKDAAFVCRRVCRLIKPIKSWKVELGTYHDIPNIEATWFIDPPYQTPPDAGAHTAGNAYIYGANGIDYAELAGWCMSRRGQVIVCEQEPAQWLPFTPFADQINGSSVPAKRTEVVWHRGSNQCEQTALTI